MFYLNDNENATYQNWWGKFKVELIEGDFIILIAYRAI